MTQMLSHLAQRRAKPMMLGLIAFLVAITGIVIVFVQDHGIAHAQGNQFYVNCSAGSNGDGNQGSPWNSVNSVNSHGNFNAGDTIYFNRGTTCSGSLQPQGSGSSSSAPITIDAYGSGAQPVIDGGTGVANTFELNGQQYWVIQNLEIRGGTNRGVYITGTASTTSTPLVLTYFRLTNLTVDNVNPSLATPDGPGNGLIDIQPIYGPDNSGLDFTDVVLNNVQASNTGQFDGIRIGNGGNSQRGHTNITIENSTLHDTAGDGIAIFGVTTGLLQNNVVYNNGKNANCDKCYSPVGLWNYQSNGVTVQNNEVYDDSYTGNTDGGAFDIDFFNDNSLYQYNYGHDNNGNCVDMLSGGANSFRYNVCANNARNNLTGSTMSDYFVRGGQVYNNTSYWNPTANNPAILQGSSVDGSAFVKNNLIYSASPNLLSTGSNTGLPLNNNLYWYTGSGNPSWSYNGTTYTGFSAYQSGSGQDAQGLYADPKLNNPTYHSVGKPTSAFTLQSGSPAIGAGAVISTNGGRDFFGNTVSATCAPNIGADNTGAPTSCAGGGTTVNDTALTYSGSGWGYYPGRSYYGITDYNNDVHATQNNGDCVSYTFTGTGVSYVTEEDASQGNVDVYLDDLNNKLTTVNTSTTGSRVSQQVPFNTTTLSPGSHTLKLCKASGQWMLIDALVVHTSSTTLNDTALTYSGSGWGHFTSRSSLGATDYNDDVHATQNNGDCVSYTFTGTGIAYITEEDASQGNVDIYLDDLNNKLTTVNTSTSGSRLSQQVPFNTVTLSNTQHTIKLCKASGQWMLIDALTVTS